MGAVSSWELKLSSQNPALDEGASRRLIERKQRLLRSFPGKPTPFRLVNFEPNTGQLHLARGDQGPRENPEARVERRGDAKIRHQRDVEKDS